MTQKRGGNEDNEILGEKKEKMESLRIKKINK